MGDYDRVIASRISARNFLKKKKTHRVDLSTLGSIRNRQCTNDFFDIRDITFDKPLPKASRVKKKQSFISNVISRERFDQGLDKLLASSDEETVESKDWTVKEKRQLIKALKKFGFHDYEKMKTYLPNKEESEIRIFINNLGKKAQKETEQDNTQMVQTSPLPGWVKVMTSAIKPSRKRDDFSLVLSEVFDHISQGKFPSPSKSPGTPDFASIYSYLRELLAGRVPPSLGEVDQLTFANALDVPLDLPMRLDFPREFTDKISKIAEDPTIVEATERKGKKPPQEHVLHQMDWLNPLHISPEHLENIREQLHLLLEYDHVAPP